ncbi:MAG: hypothetical protein KBA66_18830 [Leptospiraceae bacterium]|nr:hypothetical protein [Leptospiraceae bacterium]
MKQFSLLFILLSFILSSVILGSADNFNSNSGNFVLTDDKEKKSEEINVKPKEEKPEEKPSEKSEETKEKPKSDGKKGFGGNRFKYKKDKDKK